MENELRVKLFPAADRGRLSRRATVCATRRPLILRDGCCAASSGIVARERSSALCRGERHVEALRREIVRPDPELGRAPVAELELGIHRGIAVDLQQENEALGLRL